MTIPRVGWALSPSLWELKSKWSSPPVVKFTEFDKSFEVYTRASDFALAECWCKVDGHCIWEHEAQWLSKGTANSWEIILRRSTLLGDVATLVGVAQDQDVYKENVSLKNFGTQVQVSAKPLRWHNTLALMRWIWSTKWAMTIWCVMR